MPWSKYQHLFCGQTIHTGQTSQFTPHCWPVYSWQGKEKKKQLGNNIEQRFACIIGKKTKERLSKARCVSLQGKKETCSPLRSSHILLLLVSVKQWGVCIITPSVSERFRKLQSLNAVDASSIILQTSLFQVD